MGEFDEIIEEFLIESQESLDRLDQDLVALEERPRDAELLARIFRCAHTIKGTSGFLGFGKLESLTHAGESLLSRLRDGELLLTPDITTHLLAMVDAIRQMLRAIQQSGGDGDATHEELILSLKRAMEPVGEAPARADEKPASSKPKKRKRRAPEAEIAAARAALAPPAAEYEHAEVALAPLVASTEDASAKAREAAFDSVRVDVGLLDHLMDLAGELVLTRNQIRQVQQNLGDGLLNAASQRLNLVTMGLQEGIMRMRMQPIDNVLSKFPRMVRDVARSCNKSVRLEMDGKSTELDKTLIESIKDPLTHLLRNAIDHGIEPPEARSLAGKPVEGRILIRAFHQSGQVHIEIADDGAGINVERVKHKAIQQGLISAERADAMGDNELVNLVFVPGFSTAQAVTNVSGRGVGMDVVKTNVERIGGAIEIESRAGRGTTFRIKVPLTLAIVPALIVTASGSRYAVPQVSLQELVVVDADRGRQRIEQVHGAPVYRLRDKLLPLVYLSQQLGCESREACFAKPKVHIAVLFAGGRQFGLVVDHVSDQQEIVVKPLAGVLKNLNVFAGATIMGDGRVVLILDVGGIAQRASLATDNRDDPLAATRASVARPTDTLTSLLLLRGPDDARLAVPLARVARLETIAQDRVEETAGSEVLQYGDEIMPIVRIASVLPERRSRLRHPELDVNPPEYLNLVVVLTGKRHLGIVVHEVLDVVDVPLVLKGAGSRAGVAGTLVIQQRVTELLDLDWVIEQSGVPPAGLLEAG